MFGRRDFLIAGSAFALAACSGEKMAEVKTEEPVMDSGNKIAKVGLQTYTLREALGQDFEGTLAMIKEVGYDYVELNDRNFSDRTPAELKAALDAVGLPSPASHVGIDMVRNDLSGVISAAKTLELDYVIVPYIGDHERSLEDWKAHARTMDSAGAILRDEGVKMAYHNHQFEFDDLGGTTAMEVLMADTNPDNVCFEMDIFWTVLADVDPTALIKKYPGRFKACHIKDMKGDARAAEASGASYDDLTRDYMVDVGTGDIDFTPVFALNDVSGMELFIAEHDQPKQPYRNAIETSLTNIRAMRF